jgi:hypothetical protein
MSENGWIQSYRRRIENLNRTLQECVMKNTSDGLLDLNETLFLLRGSVYEIEKIHKENEILKNDNLVLKNTINKEMEQLEEAISGS